MRLFHLFDKTERTDVFALGEKRLARLHSENRYSCYRNTRAMLHKLSLYRNGKRLPADQVTPEFVAGFRDFLLRQMGNSHNTVVENIKILSYLLDEAGIRPNPCSTVPLSREPTRREYLLEDELKRIMDLKIKAGSALDISRDIFFVECRTGLRISDLLQLRWQAYDGSFIRLQMQKTKRPVEVPVTRSVRRVLEKYRDLFSSGSAYIFPVLSVIHPRRQDFSQARALVYATGRINIEIKRLASLAGIPKQLSTHMARHTFATMLISKGASIYDVKELLGHQDIKVTQVYAHLLDSRKQQLVEMLE